MVQKALTPTKKKLLEASLEPLLTVMRIDEMGKSVATLAVSLTCLAAVSNFSAPSAHATAKWVATANSPSHEQIEFAWGMSQAEAESRVMAQCARIERADDCQLLASGPDCVGIAWDGDQPINHAHAVSGGGRDVVIQGAIAAAGPHANGAEARCSWDR